MVKSLPLNTKLYRRDENYFLIQDCIARGGNSIIYNATLMHPSGERASATDFCLKECVPSGYLYQRNRFGILHTDGLNMKAGSFLWDMRFRFLHEEEHTGQEIANRILAEAPQQSAEIIAIEVPGQDIHYADVRKFGNATVSDLCFLLMRDMTASGTTLFSLIQDLESCDNDQNTGRMTILHVAEIMEKVTEMMRQIHMAGYVAGDLTPSNIWVFRKNGTALKDMVFCPFDFGCTRRLLTHQNKTVSVRIGEIAATAGFSFAPELIAAKRDGRISLTKQFDQYAIGQIFYRLLKGERYFQTYIVDKERDIQSGKNVCFPRFSFSKDDLKGRRMNPDTQIVLRKLLRTCLQENPEGRYTDENETCGDDILLNDIREFSRLASKPIEHVLKSVPVLDMDSSLTLKAFTGREQELLELDRRLKSGNCNPIWITAPGGIGKTSFVEKYASEHPEYIWGFAVYRNNLMDTIASLSFDDDEYLRNDSLTASGDSFQSEEEQRSAAAREQFKRFQRNLKWLGAYGNYLCLIVDNFDAKDYNKSFTELMNVRCVSTSGTWTNRDILYRLKQEKIHLVFTTRTKRASGDPDFMELTFMEEDTLLQMTQNIMGRKINFRNEEEEKMMRQMIQAVDRHTMMISMIAASIRERINFWQNPFDKMYQLVKREDYGNSPDILSERDNTEATIDAHMRAIFRFNGFTKTEQGLLAILSLIPVTGFSLKLFKELMEKIVQCVQMEKMLDRFQKLHILLIRNQCIYVHPLTSHYMAEMIVKNEKTCQLFINNILNYHNSEAIEHQLFFIEESLRTIAETEVAIVHQTSIVKIEPDQGKLQRIHLLRDASRIFYQWYFDAHNTIACAQKILEFNDLLSLKHDNETNAFQYDYYGTIFLTSTGSMQGSDSLKKALNYHLRGLEIKNNIYLKENESIAISYDHIGLDYMELYDIKASIRYYYKALNIRIDLLNSFFKENTDVFSGGFFGAVNTHILELKAKYFDSSIFFSGIDSDYVPLKEWDEILRIWRKESEIQQAIYPYPLHKTDFDYFVYESRQDIWGYEKATDYAWKQKELAEMYFIIGRIYSDLNRYEDALLYQMHALKTLQSVYPDGIQEMVFIYDDIASSHYMLGRYKESLIYARKALNLYKIGLGHNDLSFYQKKILKIQSAL